MLRRSAGMNLRLRFGSCREKVGVRVQGNVNFQVSDGEETW